MNRALTLVLILSLGFMGFGIQSGQSSPGSFVLAAAGDFGANSNTDTVLGGIGSAQANFALAVGDLSYSQSGTEPKDGVTPSPWCNYVKGKIPAAGNTFPFELVSGNHEVDGATNGRIDNFARCLPNLISSATGSGLCGGRDPALGAGGCYGTEYYFDYPTSSPIARIILVYHSSSDTIDSVRYDFGKGTVHYNWLSSVIDQAKSAGLWTIVATHKPCLSTGSGGSGCDMHRLFASKRVDLVIGAHDHNYQRSKQLTCFDTSSFDASCVADDGSDNLYSKGAGTVYTIVGTGGGGLSSISTSKVQNQYFRTWSGSNVNPTYGFLKISLESASLSATFVPTRSGGSGGGTYTDSFTITGGAPPPPPTFDYGLSIVPSSGTVFQGGSVSSLLTATLVSGSAEGVTFSATGLPFGVTVTFSPASCNPTCYSSVTLNVDPNAATGTFSITMGGVSAGGLVRTTTYVLTVQEPGTGTFRFNATADAYIRSARPDINFGGSTTLEVDASPDIKAVLLKFDVSGIGNGTITSARLRLFCVGGSDMGGDFYKTSILWDEATVTWNLAPGPDGASLGSLGKVDTLSWYEIDVTFAVTGQGLVAFKVQPLSSNGADYSSRETSNRPQLVVITGGTPPPPPVFDYGLSINPSSGVLTQGGSVSSLLTATLVSGNTESVTFSATGLPSGVTVAFSPTSCSPTCSSSAVFNATPNAAIGTVALTLSGTSSGGLVRTTTYTLTVQATGARTLRFNATADAYVRNTLPDSNFGTSSTLEIDNSPDVKMVLLKFNITGIGNETITSVKLRLFSVGRSDMGGDFYKTSILWDEATVTWNLAPGPDGASLGSLGAVAALTWYEIDVTSAVTSNGLVAFMVLPLSSDGADYSSREAANDPQLIVTLSN